jgi:NAD(P)-dependent dehydrogenase (short-subunit alcohol dehydrogenase family)
MTLGSEALGNRENLEDAFAINVLGAHWVTREFLPLLQQGHLKKVMNM